MIHTVILETEIGDDPWWLRPRALGKLGYALLRLGDPDLAQREHDATGDKSFTLHASTVRDWRRH